MRVCLAYDCLFPWTVGGEERHLRHLAEGLVAAGHDVTYLTRRQWPLDAPPQIPGVRVIAVSREEPLYDEAGRRRTAEALHYGLGVLRHLVRHRRAYDVVHAVSFPYFSLPAARVALAGARVPVLVDWPEVWGAGYWREYLGAKGVVGVAVQRICAWLTPEAFVISRLHGDRLRGEGVRGPVTLIEPLTDPPAPHPATAPPAPPTVLFVGRMIPEKRASLVPAAIALARERIPGLRGLIVGDGPELEAVRAAIAAHALEDVVEAPGFVDGDAVRRAFERATCLLAPSSREGYGIVVLEAAAAATPAIVVREPDNAMTERVEDGVNGLVAASADPAALADAIVAVHARGAALRESTAAWAARAAAERGARTTVEVVRARYRARIDSR